MSGCEICGMDHDQELETIDGQEWVFCSRFGSWLNLSEHYAEIERLEEMMALEHERKYEKDLASQG